MQVLSAEILEAGSIDGANEWRVYSRIALPLSTPSLAETATFLFVMVWNDLLIPMLLINSKWKLKLSLAMLQFRGEYVTHRSDAVDWCCSYRCADGCDVLVSAAIFCRGSNGRVVERIAN
ncbi:ABC transporter permease subunit [Paenibacillus ferrarius]|uniref:ABC transporter permease subunit n=1 Tax=Paenibacillus ferrarius TaxID=1469647 RepID=UPI001FC9C441|nr:ABC transporter permease subunit [Paenibacillus ferrarius]